jgi:hypothetical protein
MSWLLWLSNALHLLSSIGIQDLIIQLKKRQLMTLWLCDKSRYNKISKDTGIKIKRKGTYWMAKNKMVESLILADINERQRDGNKLRRKECFSVVYLCMLSISTYHTIKG